LKEKGNLFGSINNDYSKEGRLIVNIISRLHSIGQ